MLVGRPSGSDAKNLLGRCLWGERRSGVTRINIYAQVSVRRLRNSVRRRFYTVRLNI